LINLIHWLWRISADEEFAPVRLRARDLVSAELLDTVPPALEGIGKTAAQIISRMRYRAVRLLDGMLGFSLSNASNKA
jgi:hypothetical protein